VDAIADDPTAGDLMPGTGGARKRRFRGRGKGKSGGYRGDDVPVLALALVDKGERADLTKAERNALARELANYAREYRTASATRLRRLR
jgi:hypothetical protein